MTPLIVAAADPFTPYPGMETQAAKGGGGNGKGKGQSPVPESATYGCALVAAMLFVFFISRALRRSHGCCGKGCGCH